MSGGRGGRGVGFVRSFFAYLAFLDVVVFTLIGTTDNHHFLLSISKHKLVADRGFKLRLNCLKPFCEVNRRGICLGLGHGCIELMQRSQGSPLRRKLCTYCLNVIAVRYVTVLLFCGCTANTDYVAYLTFQSSPPTNLFMQRARQSRAASVSDQKPANMRAQCYMIATNHSGKFWHRCLFTPLLSRSSVIVSYAEVFRGT